MQDASQLTAQRIERITRRAIMGDHENGPLPLDDVAEWRDEIEGAAQLGIAKAWAQNWRSDTALTKAARRAAINEALAEHRRSGAAINHSGELVRLAKRVNAQPCDLADDVITVGEPNPPAGIELDEQAALARELLATLPPDERQAIELCTMHGATQQEAAQRMGISQASVSRLIAAGLKTLRECME